MGLKIVGGWQDTHLESRDNCPHHKANCLNLEPFGPPWCWLERANKIIFVIGNVVAGTRVQDDGEQDGGEDLTLGKGSSNLSFGGGECLRSGLGVAASPGILSKVMQGWLNLTLSSGHWYILPLWHDLQLRGHMDLFQSRGLPH